MYREAEDCRECHAHAREGVMAKKGNMKHSARAPRDPRAAIVPTEYGQFMPAPAGKQFSPRQLVHETISDAEAWARRILVKNGIDPDSIGPDIDITSAEWGWENGRHVSFVHALVIFDYVRKLRMRFSKASETELNLAAELIAFCSQAWAARVGEFDRQLHVAWKVFEGGARGRATRPPKLTAKQKADIRQEMAAAKHGTKKATKEELAQKHKISVREIERIAAQK